jgi:glycosyltransferase involved in cell wall biosynthesis
MTLVGGPEGDSLSPLASRHRTLRGEVEAIFRRSDGRRLKPFAAEVDAAGVSVIDTRPAQLQLPKRGELIALGRKAAGEAGRAALAGHVASEVVPRASGAPARLRVAMLVPRVDIGGGARILLEHANRLHVRGHDVLVIAHFPKPNWLDLRAGYRHVPAGIGLADALEPCDLVVCGYWDQVGAARAAAVAPVVHFEQGDFHLFEDIPPAARGLVQTNMDLADATTTVSARVASVLRDRYGLEDVGVVHNAVDASVFRADGARRAGAPYLLCVGWDGNAFKGIADVRALWRRAREEHPDLDLVWVTPRPPVEPMGTVVVAPSQDELASIYRGASVYLCASHYESFPLPPLEAMACGAPVVTTANVGVLEYARHGENALVVPVGDVAAMLAAVERVLDEPELAPALRSGGASTAASFSWDRIIDDLEVRYRDIAGSELAGLDVDTWECRLSGAVEARAGAAARLQLALRTSTAAEILVPVVRPAIEGHRIASWEVAARRTAGSGTARVYAPHRVEGRGALPYQAGIDALDAGRPQAALDIFMAAFRAAASNARRGALAKWVALSLLELGQTDASYETLEASIRAFPDNPDHTYLAALVAPMAGRTADVEHARANVRVIGEGTRYDDWFAAPAALLDERARE